MINKDFILGYGAGKKSGGGGGGGDAFVITATGDISTNPPSFEFDKTFAEIQAAYAAGKIISAFIDVGISYYSADVIIGSNAVSIYCIQPMGGTMAYMMVTIDSSDTVLFHSFTWAAEAH